MADAVDLTAHPISRQRATLRIAALRDTRDRLARDLAQATAALAAVTADRDRAVRERDEAVAAARRDGMEEAARIADEFAAENLRMAMDSIHLDPALASADFSPEAQKMTKRMQAHGAHHAGSSAGCEQVAAAIRAAALAARTGGWVDGE